MTPSPSTLPGPDPTLGSKAQPSRWLEIAVAVTAVALTSTVLVLGRSIELRVEVPGMNPRSWPTFLGGLGLGLSLILLITAIVKSPQPRDDVEATTRSGWFKLLLTVAATIAFVVTWPLLGFLVTAPVFIAAATAIAGGRGIRQLLIYPVMVAGLIYALFNLLLRVPL
jgi:hypothetical protein